MGETFGESDRAGVGVGPNGEEGEFFGLLGGRGGQLGSPVPQLNDEQTGQAVEIPASLIVPDVRALTLDDDGYVTALVVRGVSGEVHPQVVAGGVGERGLGGFAYVVRQCAHRVPQE